MGVASYHKIPILMKDDGSMPYPPTSGGLQRRIARDYMSMLSYLVKVEDTSIGMEALFMYNVFDLDGMG